MFTTIAIFILSITFVFESHANPIVLHDSLSKATSYNTIVARAEASSYPYGDALPNEFQWRNWDPNNEEHKKSAQKIHSAFVEWQAFVKAGFEATSQLNSATFQRWFKAVSNADEVRRVFTHLWDPVAGTAAKPVSQMICDAKDFVNFCKENRRGYAMAASGEFHICLAGLSLPLNSELPCQNLDESCSAAMRTLPMTLLHEMTHYDGIGTVARGGIPIVDRASGAYRCFMLSQQDQLANAQSYAWLAGESYWSGQCSTTFRDPDVNVKTTSDDEITAAPSDSDGPSCMGTAEFHQEEAESAIVRFCSDPRWRNLVVVPPVSMGNMKTSKGLDKVVQITGEFELDDDVQHLWLDVTFAESTCIGSSKFNQDECLTQFRTILNGCDTAGLFPKHGGLIRDVCMVYRMVAGPANEPKPYFLQWTDPRTLGNFTCTDTNIPGVDPSSPLANSCTCWYSGMDTVMDTFHKPEGGCSKVTKSSNPITN